jgi:peptide/nickel transport system substrate-binding protein
MLKRTAFLMSLSVLASPALAQQGEPVPEIHFLSWPTATYQHFAETANYVAEEWEKLGLRIRMDQQAFPNPMLQMWFTDHDFDVVLSNLSGAPHRMEPDFFTNSQFNSANTAPGNWNVGEYSNPEFDELGKRQLGIYDPEARREIIFELQRMIVDEQPETVVAAPITVFAINKNNMEFDGYIDSPQGIRANANQVRMRSLRDQDLVRIGWTVEYTVLNPTAARTIEETELAALLYDRLIWVAPDGSPKMRLAESIDTIDDVTLEVKIRTDHTFSDGQPVTAEDVKFSFDYMKEWNAPYFTQHLARLESVDVVDQATIRFTLTEPYAPFVMNTLGQMYVLPRHVWEPLVEDLGLENPQQFANDQPIGSGPFTVRYRREGSELYLSRRDDHFDPPLADILYVIFGSAEIVAQSLKAGSIDASFQPVPPAGVEEFEAHSALQLYRAESNGHISLRYKTTGPVFWNRDLRRALFHAVPYDRIIEEVLGGMAVKTSTPITPVNAFWHDSDLPTPQYDLDRAREILSEAGFTWDDANRLHFPPQ